MAVEDEGDAKHATKELSGRAGGHGGGSGEWDEAAESRRSKVQW
jgi:hypothetical protein